jgi:hypothetical protein
MVIPGFVGGASVIIDSPAIPHGSGLPTSQPHLPAGQPLSSPPSPELVM